MILQPGHFGVPKLYVRFVHLVNDFPKFKRSQLGMSLRKSTVCLLGDDEVIGEAICHPKDQFCKKTGRKKAFGKALIKMFPDSKVVRQAYWLAFLRKEGIL